MKSETKTTLIAALYSCLSISCLLLMYISYKYYGTTDQNLFSLSVGVFGAGFGFFLSRSFSVRSENQLQRILGAALIKEKELESKTVEEARDLYQKELEHLQEIIEQEGNKLLLKRLKEVRMTEIQEKLREIYALDDQLKRVGEQTSTPEIEEVRNRLEGLLIGVRNPEEDDRLIKQFCYSIPLFGNLIYVLYLTGKRINPTLQQRVHRHLSRLFGLAAQRKVLISASVSIVLLISLAIIVVLLVQR